MAFVKVGDRIRYIGYKGQKSRSDDWKPGAWLEAGIIGTVTEYHPAVPKQIVRGEVFEGFPPYAVVQFDNGARTCIDGNKDGRKRWVKLEEVK